MSYTIPNGLGNGFSTTRSLIVQPGQVSVQSGQNYFSYFGAPNATSGSASFSATVYVQGPLYGVSVTNNYALYVASGVSYLQSLILGSNFSSSGSIAFTGVGNLTNNLASLYVAPASTAFSGVSDYYFSYFDVPQTTGSTSGSAYTVFIAGAPANATSAYALYVNAGIVSIASNIASTSPTTGSLVVTGGVGISGALTVGGVFSAPNGTSSLPSYTFVNDLTSGLYLNSVGNISLTAGTIQALTCNSLTTSVLNTFSPTKTGSTVVSTGTMYVAPASTTGSASTFYFSYFGQPTITGTTATNASTVYIANAPTNATNAYSLYIAAGKLFLGGSFQMSTGASNGYVLVSDASGNGTWQTLAAAFAGFIDGSVGAPGGYFASETTTGFYRPGSGQIAVALAGVNTANFSATATSTSVTLSPTKTGSSTASTSTVYVNPSSTTFAGSANYYFSYFNTPSITGATTGIASTVYIAGSPANATTAYSLQIGAGNVALTGVSSALLLSNTTISTSTSTGAIQNAGGMYSLNHYIGGATFPNMAGTIIGPLLNVAATTITATNNSEMAFVSIQQPTLAATVSQTTANASTLYIANAPAAGTNESITNAYALKINSGRSYLGGGAQIGGANGTSFNQLTTGSQTFASPNLASTQNATAVVSLSGFTVAPVITASVIWSGTNQDGIVVTLKNVTSASFTIEIYNSFASTTTGNIIVNYICIGN